MAGDWIPVRIDLHEDPAVMAIAEQLGCREEVVVGYLVRIWGWVSRQCNADTVTDVTLSALGRVTSLPGFPEMMVQVGWLESGETDDGRPFIRIVNYDRWLSKTAKVRATTRLRVKKTRENGGQNVTEMYGKCNGASVTKSLPQNRTEQKRTEETYLIQNAAEEVPPKTAKKKKNPNGERAYSQRFETMWANFDAYDCPKGDKGRAADLYEALSSDAQDDFDRAAVLYCQERHATRQKTQHLSTLLGNSWRQYLDDAPVKPAIDSKQKQELAAAEKSHRGELYRAWQSACVVADGQGRPKPPKPEELTRPPVHYQQEGFFPQDNNGVRP